MKSYRTAKRVSLGIKLNIFASIILLTLTATIAGQVRMGAEADAKTSTASGRMAISKPYLSASAQIDGATRCL
jgi:hypothetical protein